MNVFRRILQNLSQKRFFQKKFFKTHHVSPYSFKNRYIQITLASTLISQGKITVEDDLHEAILKGEAAILDLMTQLQDLVVIASKEYRSCLTKQIELIQKVTSGQSDAWDELLKFRSLANELHNELNEYLILLKTLGEMAYNQTILSFEIDKRSIEVILKKYKELELLLLREFEQNKKKEFELLEVNVASIKSTSKD